VAQGASAPFAFLRVAASGGDAPIERAIAVEMPVAIEFNGIGYAVLMATPAELEDLAVGFALAERLIDGAADIVDVESHAAPAGMIVRVTLAAGVSGRIVDRVRHRVSESSCGLCGIENLEQPLGRETRAVHGAAACSIEGLPWLVREDVGRHNAFDKLIGAMLRRGAGWDGGFALLTSRCSYELVEKAVLSGCPMLATISAPTSLAIGRAAAAGLPLRVLVRSDALLAVPPA
jgi:FdhD protein